MATEREGLAQRQRRRVTPADARMGVRVLTPRGFSGVPAGTEGVIDEDYGTGVMVAWDLKDRPLPPGYREWSGRGQAYPGEPLRDGFDKETELGMLELVE